MLCRAEQRLVAHTIVMYSVPAVMSGAKFVRYLFFISPTAFFLRCVYTSVRMCYPMGVLPRGTQRGQRNAVACSLQCCLCVRPFKGVEEFWFLTEIGHFAHGNRIVCNLYSIKPDSVTKPASQPWCVSYIVYSVCLFLYLIIRYIVWTSICIKHINK